MRIDIVPKERMFETWSNAAYAVAGLIYYLVNPGTTGFFYALALLTLAAGSGWYHARKDWPIVVFDFWGMYLVLGLIIFLNVSSGMAVLPITYGVLFYLLLAATAVFMGRIEVFFGVEVYFAMAFGTLLFVAPLWQVIVAAIFLGSGLAIRQYGEASGGDKEHNAVFHSVWHLLTAMGFFFMVG